MGQMGQAPDRTDEAAGGEADDEDADQQGDRPGKQQEPVGDGDALLNRGHGGLDEDILPGMQAAVQLDGAGLEVILGNGEAFFLFHDLIGPGRHVEIRDLYKAGGPVLEIVNHAAGVPDQGEHVAGLGEVVHGAAKRLVVVLDEAVRLDVCLLEALLFLLGIKGLEDEIVEQPVEQEEEQDAQHHRSRDLPQDRVQALALFRFHRQPFLCFEFVSDPPDGADMVAVFTELAAQLFDVGVHCPGVPVIIIAPHVVEDFVPDRAMPALFIR